MSACEIDLAEPCTGSYVGARFEPAGPGDEQVTAAPLPELEQ